MHCSLFIFLEIADCNGIIDDDERELAHRVLVEEFFKDKSADELKLYDVEFAKNTHRTNVNKMLASHKYVKSLMRLFVPTF